MSAFTATREEVASLELVLDLVTDLRKCEGGPDVVVILAELDGCGREIEALLSRLRQAKAPTGRASR